MMKIIDRIKDDEQFCEEENNTIYCYLDLKGLLNITDGEWDLLYERGLCCEDIAKYHIEALHMTIEDESRMAAQLLKEAQEAELGPDGGIAKRLHWWNRGTTPEYIQQDIKYLFPEVKKEKKMKNEDAAKILEDMTVLTQEAAMAVTVAVDVLERERWHVKAKEGNPKKAGEYLVTHRYIKSVFPKYYSPENGWNLQTDENIIAWRPLPEAYKENE